MFSLHGKKAFITRGTSGIGIGVGTGSAPVAVGLPGGRGQYQRDFGFTARCNRAQGEKSFLLAGLAVVSGAQYYYVGTGFPVRGMVRRCATDQSLVPQLGHRPCAARVLLISVFLAYTLKLNGHEHHRPVTHNAFLSGDSPIVD